MRNITKVGSQTDEGVISEFLQFLALGGRNTTGSTATRSNYQSTLRRLSRWLNIRGQTLLTAAPDDIAAWRAELTLSPKTISTYGATVKSFYLWARRAGRRVDDPTLDLILPRVPPGLPRPIGEADLEMAIQTAPRRIRPWLVLAGYAGFRAIEIAQLERSQILNAADPPMFLFGGKGARWRAVPLSPYVWGELLAADLPTRGPCFRRQDGRIGANSANRISQLANRHLRELGVDGTLHGCRHRFGTQALLACGNVRTVQELLGHASIITTQLYTAIASPEMVAVVLAVQPANPIPNSAA